MRIFADASALVALFRTGDPNHQKALILSKQLAGNVGLISKYIFAEIVTILSQKEGKKQAIDAGETLKKHFKWVQLDEEMEQLAWEIFTKQESKNVSFVDCTTFALYQKGVFDKAFTFDSDFKSNKIPVLG